MEIDANFLAAHVEYSRAATEKILTACEPLGRDELSRLMYTSYTSVLGTLVHIYQADAIWMKRLQGFPLSTMEEPKVNTVAELREIWMPVYEGLKEVARNTTAERVERPVPFRSATRGDCTMPTWQVFLHVVNHASYHRGQITTMLRQLGHNAVSTDMSFYWLDAARAGAAS